MPVDDRGRVDRPPAKRARTSSAAFLDALSRFAPREAGGILFSPALRRLKPAFARH
jgi:hypothetical protein